MHRTFSEIGDHLANGWGRDDGGNLDKYIQGLRGDETSNCLLAAIVNELRSVRRAFYAVSGSKPEVCNAVSDGMYQWLRCLSGDVSISAINKSGLSTRARRALLMAKIATISEVTEERLSGVRNCGALTIRELVDWAKTVDRTDLSRSDEDNSVPA
jgi:hypothetical protein